MSDWYVITEGRRWTGEEWAKHCRERREAEEKERAAKEARRLAWEEEKLRQYHNELAREECLRQERELVADMERINWARTLGSYNMAMERTYGLIGQGWYTDSPYYRNPNYPFD